MDRKMRVMTGSMLIMAGHARAKARCGGLGATMMVMLGTALLETALTRVCPLNKLMDIDSCSADLIAKDRNEVLMQSPEPLDDRIAPGGMLDRAEAGLSLPS